MPLHRRKRLTLPSWCIVDMCADEVICMWRRQRRRTKAYEKIHLLPRFRVVCCGETFVLDVDGCLRTRTFILRYIDGTREEAKAAHCKAAPHARVQFKWIRELLAPFLPCDCLPKFFDGRPRLSKRCNIGLRIRTPVEDSRSSFANGSVDACRSHSERNPHVDDTLRHETKFAEITDIAIQCPSTSLGASFSFCTHHAQVTHTSGFQAFCFEATRGCRNTPRWLYDAIQGAIHR